MQPPFELNHDNQKTPSSLAGFERVTPISLENYDLSEHLTPTPTEELSSTINNKSIIQDTHQKSLSASDISFNFGPLLQKYQNYVTNCQQAISHINDAIVSVNGMTNFDVIKNAKLDNYNVSKTKIEESVSDYNIRIQNIANIQNLSQADLDNLYILFTYTGNMEGFLTMLTVKYSDILADKIFINLMSDKLNSTNNKTIIAQYICQAYSQ